MDQLTINEMLNTIGGGAQKIHKALAERDIGAAKEAYGDDMESIVSDPAWNPSKYAPKVKELMEKIGYNIKDPLCGLLYNKPKNLNEEVDKILDNILKDIRRIREELGRRLPN